MNTNVTISDEQMEKIKAISEQTGVAADDLEDTFKSLRDGFEKRHAKLFPEG